METVLHGSANRVDAHVATKETKRGGSTNTEEELFTTVPLFKEGQCGATALHCLCDNLLRSLRLKINFHSLAGKIIATTRYLYPQCCD
ncbi:MAG: hypothetical protein IJZ22_09160 [Bacteroidaceae bacterium]|nr:hypothetical protein [Bacteroidaceae bacterium]